MTEAKIIELGYFNPKLLATGEWAAMYRFMYTTGIVVGIDDVGYRIRYCYDRPAHAMLALAVWDGHGDPPGPWIKRKGRLRDGTTSDDPNPAFAEGIPEL